MALIIRKLGKKKYELGMCKLEMMIESERKERLQRRKLNKRVNVLADELEKNTIDIAEVKLGI